MRNLPKDEEYWNAVKNLQLLDADIKQCEDTIVQLKHLRTEQMNRIVQSSNWILDVDPDWTQVVGA